VNAREMAKREDPTAEQQAETQRQEQEEREAQLKRDYEARRRQIEIDSF
jgi:hypothetical protein